MVSERPSDNLRRYWLVRHVYVCALDDGGVLLDLRRDRYFGVSSTSMNALAMIVPGWPTPGSSPPPVDAHFCSQDLEALAASFVAQGLLTRDPTAGKHATPARLTEASTLVDLRQELRCGRRIQLRDLVRFCYAYFSTWRMRRQPLHKTMEHVSTRKQGAAPTAFDAIAAAELLDVFHRLRSYLLSLDGKCLEHALLLLNFLACYKVFPQWVIGVKAPAFAAHSWVQEGVFVLDATPEEVCFYTPILAI